MVNEDCLNISATTEHCTDEIGNSYAVNYANGALHSSFGYALRSRDIHGLSIYPKAAPAMVWKKLKLSKASEFVRRIDFHVDARASDGMQDVAAYVK